MLIKTDIDTIIENLEETRIQYMQNIHVYSEHEELFRFAIQDAIDALVHCQIFLEGE